MLDFIGANYKNTAFVKSTNGDKFTNDSCLNNTKVWIKCENRYLISCVTLLIFQQYTGVFSNTTKKMFPIKLFESNAR